MHFVVSLLGIVAPIFAPLWQKMGQTALFASDERFTRHKGRLAKLPY